MQGTVDSEVDIDYTRDERSVNKTQNVRELQVLFEPDGFVNPLCAMTLENPVIKSIILLLKAVRIVP